MAGEAKAKAKARQGEAFALDVQKFLGCVRSDTTHFP
jgi:hypothetical protein